MSRRREPSEDEGLLDLPLEPPPGAAAEPSEDASEEDGFEDAPPARSRRRREPPENLSLFERDREEASGAYPSYRDDEAVSDRERFEHGAIESPSGREPERGRSDERGSVSLFERLVAGIADIVLLVGVLAVMMVALVFLGTTPRLALWPGLVGFLVSFSFLYVTLPLAFWGQTPGMAWARLQARDLDDRPLAFSQTVVRWLAGVLTVVTAGLPVLIGLSGRSLGDLLSRSVTHRLELDSDPVS